MMIWYLASCDCEDGYTYVCPECPSACDHDQLCLQCKGEGLYPKKALTLIDILGSIANFRTKRAAWAYILGTCLGRGGEKATA